MAVFTGYISMYREVEYSCNTVIIGLIKIIWFNLRFVNIKATGSIVCIRDVLVCAKFCTFRTNRNELLSVMERCLYMYCRGVTKERYIILH